MYTAQKCKSYGKTTDKLVLRVFKDGCVDPILAQWRFDYISDGKCPAQYGGDNFIVPNDILVELFMDSFPEHFSNKVFNTTKPVSNKPIVNANTPSIAVNTNANATTKNDVIISAIRNSGGNKSILMKCLELSKDYDVINEVINNCNSDPTIILRCLSLLESNDSSVSVVKEDDAPVPVDNECCNDEIVDEEILDAAATTENDDDVPLPVCPIVPVTPTTPVCPIVPATPPAPVCPIVPATPPAPVDPVVPVPPTAPVDPPASRRRGKVRYNL